jgi:hypothetical protein
MQEVLDIFLRSILTLLWNVIFMENVPSSLIITSSMDFQSHDILNIAIQW